MNTPQCLWDGKAQLAEGPLWSQREQALYWVDILGRRLYRRSAAGELRRWQFEQEVSAVAERAQQPGLVLAVRHGVALFDPADGKLRALAEIEHELPSNRFNDGKCDAAGRFWVGSMDFDGKAPNGALYRVDANGGCERFDSGYPVTNGPTWSGDGRTMYFNDSAHGRVFAFDFDPERGSIANKRLFLQLGGPEGAPDGMTTDAEGCLWLAQWGAGKVTRRDADGRVLQTVELPCSQVSSCAFGGKDYRTLYITTAAVGLTPEQLAREPLAGAVFALELDVTGKPAHAFQG